MKITNFDTPFETYRNLELIGEGGAGKVFKVENSSGGVYALKILSADKISRERLKRFKNEIEFCQKNHHKNIVKVIDTGSLVVKDTKCPFYVMNLYSGTLRTQMPQLDTSKLLHYFAQILDGVEAAHLLGVWHRDLKPENILWSSKDDSFVVADFGIAHFEEEEIYTAVETKIASRMANFQYSSPEQRARGASVDYRADIYALGLILNELFTGEIPQGSGYKRISHIDSTFVYLDELVDLMIQQNPINRPRSIEDIKKELIGRRNNFIAFQKLDQLKSTVINTNDGQTEFEPISFSGFDYENGTLTLFLNRNVPPGWANEFQHPRGGYSSLLGYGPELFEIRGNRVSIPVRNDKDFIQQLINNAKNYLASANSGFQQQLREQAAQEDMRKRKELERQIAEAELKKSILSSIKL